jgi:hypothetical protein
VIPYWNWDGDCYIADLCFPVVDLSVTLAGRWETYHRSPDFTYWRKGLQTYVNDDRRVRLSARIDEYR